MLTTQEKICKLTHLSNQLRDIDLDTKWAREKVGDANFELGKLIAKLKQKAAGKIEEGSRHV